MSTEDLQVEVEKLRDKNAQLLSEKKQVVGERDDLAAAVEALEAERDHARGEIQRITVDQPRLDMLEDCAAPGMAAVLQRELYHHYDVVTQDGRDVLHHKDGTPVTTAIADSSTGEEVQKPVAFDPAGLDTLHDSDLLPGIGSMLRGSQASGGNAPGSTGGAPGQPSMDSRAKGVNFGFR